MKLKWKRLRNVICVGVVFTVFATTNIWYRITNLTFSPPSGVTRSIHGRDFTNDHQAPPSSSSLNTSHSDLSSNKNRTVGEPKDHPLLTYEQYGRLGNVMFQYAGLLGVARMNDRTPVVKPTTVLTRAFNISHVMDVSTPNGWIVIGEPNYAKYDRTFENLPDGKVYLQTYLQSYRYFQFISDEVKDEFQFLNNINKNADRMMENLRPAIASRITVGVHVRRGDMLSQKEIKSGELTAPTAYFEKAFKWMRDKYGKVVFLVATDDVGWCQNNIVKGKDVILLPRAEREVHLCFLTKCDHMIMSVGTFGWWAGWLGSGEVIYYSHPLREGTWKYERFNATDYFPPHWIGIGD